MCTSSPYCMNEFNTAYHHHVVLKSNKRLIVVMMLDSPTQGCSLGLDVSVSRRSRDAFSQRLGLVSVSEKCGKVSVSVSSRTESQTSRSRLGLGP